MAGPWPDGKGGKTRLKIVRLVRLVRLVREWYGMVAPYSYLGALDTHCDLEEARVVGAWDGLSERHEHRVDELG